MNRIFAISASLLIFFQGINFHLNDLLELDELFGHYYFHSEEYGDNFLVYISKHYGELKTSHDRQHREEQQEHEKLPFQHHTQCSQPLAFIMSPASHVGNRSEIPLAGLSNFHYQMSYSQVWGESHFQPPQHA